METIEGRALINIHEEPASDYFSRGNADIEKHGNRVSNQGNANSQSLLLISIND